MCQNRTRMNTKDDSSMDLVPFDPPPLHEFSLADEWWMIYEILEEYFEDLDNNAKNIENEVNK